MYELSTVAANVAEGFQFGDLYYRCRLAIHAAKDVRLFFTHYE